MNYDAIIISHPKDYNKIKFCYESLVYLNPSPNHVYIVTPDEITINGAIAIKDREAINAEVTDITYKRPNWIYQQLIKLYQDFTSSNIYMCVDSDVVFNRNIFFSGKTFFLSDREQHHVPYFNFMEKYFGIKTWKDHTFINDFMIFDKNICKQMLPPLDIFIQDLNIYLQHDEYLFSEFETYGNFVSSQYQGMYKFKPTKTKTTGKYGQWSDQEINILKNLCSNMPLDLFTIHTWT